MTPSGIEPATFRFVAQHLNHCATAVPVEDSNSGKNSDEVDEISSGDDSIINLLALE